jgi:hypothetical protein
MFKIITLFAAVACLFSNAIAATKICDDSRANILSINSDGSASVRSSGFVSTNNSTTTTLDASGVYTGAVEDVTDYAGTIVTIYSDQASATDGLAIEWSPDGTNWDGSDVFTIPAATQKTFSFQPVCQYMRVKYTNGGTTQAVFRLQTQLKATNFKPSSHRIADAIVDDDDAELVLAVISAEKDGNGFDHVRATASGNLKVANVEDGFSISKGDVQGHSTVHKFGNAPDFDYDSGSEFTIWDGADDGTAWENARYDYSTTAAIDTISSSDNSDTVDIEIQGLGASTNLVIQTVTLSGTNAVPLVTPLLRVFRGKNVNGSAFAGHVVAYESTPIAAGVPVDKSKIRLVIQPDNQQTEMALYTVPAGKTAYIRSLDYATAGASKTSSYICRLYARSPGGVFRLQKKIALQDGGTTLTQYTYTDPPAYTAGTDLEMTVQLTATGATAASVSGGFDMVLVDD